MLRHYLNGTVFHPIEIDWKSDKVLAILFHRSAATLYLIYFIWSMVAASLAIPRLFGEQPDVVELLFPLFIIPTAFLSFMGALYFPRFARLEMYSAGSLTTLVLVYEIFVATSFFHGDLSEGNSFILNLSHLVIPIARVMFIYLTLIKQAGERDG